MAATGRSGPPRLLNFFMLNSTEHEIYHAHVKTAAIVGVLTFISMIHAIQYESLKAIIISFFSIVVFL